MKICVLVKEVPDGSGGGQALPQYPLPSNRGQV